MIDEKNEMICLEKRKEKKTPFCYCFSLSLTALLHVYHFFEFQALIAIETKNTNNRKEDDIVENHRIDRYGYKQ